MDGRKSLIYPIEQWREKEEFLKNATDEQILERYRKELSAALNCNKLRAKSVGVVGIPLRAFRDPKDFTLVIFDRPIHLPT
jgi:hypothetical protein